MIPRRPLRPAIERRLGVVFLASIVLLASCSSLAGGAGESETTAEPTPTATLAPTATATETPTTATATPADELPTWYEPERPNTPIEPKLEESQGDRLSAVEVVERVEMADGGYSDFRLEFGAKTSMPSVDPADHGTPRASRISPYTRGNRTVRGSARKTAPSSSGRTSSRRRTTGSSACG
jgi:hypothetical protein